MEHTIDLMAMAKSPLCVKRLSLHMHSVHDAT